MTMGLPQTSQNIHIENNIAEILHRLIYQKTLIPGELLKIEGMSAIGS